MTEYEDWSTRKLKRRYIQTLRLAWVHGPLFYGDKVRTLRNELARRGWCV